MNGHTQPFTEETMTHLVLSRRVNEVIVIRHGDVVIEVQVVDVRGDKVRIGVTAPEHVKINRAEIDAAIHGHGGSNADRK